ncbi:hypothetical protein DQ04_04881020 [Trypanosoma grayi]|uniref:hypothetical protein n=1 Tax=Trypanosoma grayi TaxID=71804 RepID=UPI0004F422DA|nr:hypothetical protein DQ04_04881020 [Trypanosoma grayi]KEG09645.1 hypothetical protein DQ04_04881020 [Trypanosoma grayi]
MLNRHGTRLDIGSPEDVAELDAVEALQRRGEGVSLGGNCMMPEQELGHERHHFSRWSNSQQQQQQQQLPVGMHRVGGGSSSTPPPPPPPY